MIGENMKLGYEEIKIVSDKQDALNPEKFVGFLKKYAKMNLVPVRGQYGKYWLSGVNGYDMIDGNKYYKLDFDGRVLSIDCVGSFNAFAMKPSIIDWIKEGIENRKKELNSEK
tara:strand:+ start:129 stop:467 length:339 start_codon:yes stop_codon:yes gene_type:complete